MALRALLPEYRPETPTVPAQPALYPDDF
jgi:hypothetical protein